MRLKHGDKCPAYEHWVCGPQPLSHLNHCASCRGCKSLFIDGCECGYSPKPNCIPKFKVGQKVYRFFHMDSYNIATIRKIEWDGRFEWQYFMARERTPYAESELFTLEKEIEMYVITKHARRLMNELQEYSQRYKIPIEQVKRLLID